MRVSKRGLREDGPLGALANKLGVQDGEVGRGGDSASNQWLGPGAPAATAACRRRCLSPPLLSLSRAPSMLPRRSDH